MQYGMKVGKIMRTWNGLGRIFGSDCGLRLRCGGVILVEDFSENDVDGRIHG
jgi:hypothetical protein